MIYIKMIDKIVDIENESFVIFVHMNFKNLLFE